MPDAGSSKELITAMVGAGGALASTLITAVVGWLKDRGEVARRLSRLDDAGKRVAFLRTWAEARDELAPADAERTRNQVILQLDSIMDEFRTVSAQHAASPALAASEKRKAVGWFRKALLLYKPIRWRAWVPRIFFYLMVAETIGYGIGRRHDPDIAYFYLGAAILLITLWGISVAME
jgi:hypothetical protein